MKFEFEYEYASDYQNHMVIFAALGALNLIRANAIDAETAEVFIFNPYTIENLKNNGLDKKIVDILFRCLEINDIERIVSIETRDRSISALINDLVDYSITQKPKKYPIIRNIEN
jgi:hypothetical protein